MIAVASMSSARVITPKRSPRASPAAAAASIAMASMRPPESFEESLLKSRLPPEFFLVAPIICGNSRILRGVTFQTHSECDRIGLSLALRTRYPASAPESSSGQSRQRTWPSHRSCPSGRTSRCHHPSDDVARHRADLATCLFISLSQLIAIANGFGDFGQLVRLLPGSGFSLDEKISARCRSAF